MLPKTTVLGRRERTAKIRPSVCMYMSFKHDMVVVHFFFFFFFGSDGSFHPRLVMDSTRLVWYSQRRNKTRKGRKKRLRISDFIIILSCFIYFSGVPTPQPADEKTREDGRAGFREVGGCNSLHWLGIAVQSRHGGGRCSVFVVAVAAGHTSHQDSGISRGSRHGRFVF